jgi:hypothetical protein
MKARLLALLAVLLVTVAGAPEADAQAVKGKFPLAVRGGNSQQNTLRVDTSTTPQRTELGCETDQENTTTVNCVRVTGAATGSGPIVQAIAATGGDANIPLVFKGTGTSAPQTQAGGSTSNTTGLEGTLSINTTSTASTQTAKQTLLSFSVPASTLNLNGRCVRIRFWGTAKATANTKTQTIDFGATTVSSTGAVANNNGVWSVEALVCRTGSNTQTAIGTALSATTVAATQTTPGETDTGAITIAGTSTNVTDTDGTTAKGLLVEVLN